jgi:hypothetical protein
MAGKAATSSPSHAAYGRHMPARLLIRLPS